MKVTVEVRRIAPWRWMAEGDYDGTIIYGYGTSGAGAEEDWIVNTGRIQDLIGSAYVKEIDV